MRSFSFKNKLSKSGTKKKNHFAENEKHKKTMYHENIHQTGYSEENIYAK